MESTISNAVFLLVAGMATVFIILTLVVLTGKMLINLVNRLSPEPVNNNKAKSKIDPKIEQTLQMIVQKVTKGKAKVDRIEKI